MTLQDAKDAGRWPPTENGMPELSTDEYPDTLFLQYSFALDWEDQDWMTYDQHWLVANLARLADKAAREYRAAHECLDVFVANPNAVEGQSRLLRTADHVENCIDAVARAALFLRTRPFRAAATPAQQEMLEELHRGVRKLRNAIQHAEERLEAGKVPPGEGVFPVATSHALYFAGEEVLYAELAGLVIALWHLARAPIYPPDAGDEGDRGLESLRVREEP